MAWLNEKENWRMAGEHEYALGQKSFVVMSVIVYANLYAIAFGFIPFNDLINEGSVVGVDMFTSRLIYYVVTGQVWMRTLTGR
jgi:hypothetical protein